jgi:hypothetical protein
VHGRFLADDGAAIDETFDCVTDPAFGFAKELGKAGDGRFLPGEQRAIDAVANRAVHAATTWNRLGWNAHAASALPHQAFSGSPCGDRRQCR